MYLWSKPTPPSPAYLVLQHKTETSQDCIFKMAAYTRSFRCEQALFLSMILKNRSYSTAICYHVTPVLNTKNLSELRSKTSGANLMLKNEVENRQAFSTKCTRCSLFTFVPSHSLLPRIASVVKNLHVTAQVGSSHRTANCTSSYNLLNRKLKLFCEQLRRLQRRGLCSLPSSRICLEL